MAVQRDLKDHVLPAAQFLEVLLADQHPVGLDDQHLVLGGLLAQIVHDPGDQEDLPAGDLEHRRAECVVDAPGDEREAAPEEAALGVAVPGGRPEYQLCVVRLLEVALAGEAVRAAEIARVLIDDQVVSEECVDHGASFRQRTPQTLTLVGDYRQYAELPPSSAGHRMVRRRVPGYNSHSHESRTQSAARVRSACPAATRGVGLLPTPTRWRHRDRQLYLPPGVRSALPHTRPRAPPLRGAPDAAGGADRP